ncbi:MAG: right-handed parallel beta-helix repeat-containing protein, partial [Thermoplasmata archaeon]|nr:right-handed parallel beta-helix repeat-containing protein [Thermoplasmata archaeon]
NNQCNDSNNGIYLYGGSQYNEVIGNDASDNGHGISLWFSSNNTISGNNASGNNYGIFLYSTSNTISSNNASGNNCGIYLYDSSNNTISGNNASDNTYYGIFLYDSSYNDITYNWFCNNVNYGLYISSVSTGNSIHHNNFIRNNGASRGISDGKCQACDSGGGNSWYDNGAHEGNYWSNWDGNDWGTSDAYPITGGAGASDYCPLSSPVGEFSQFAVFVLAQLTMLFIGCRVILRSRHKTL